MAKFTNQYNDKYFFGSLAKTRPFDYRLYCEGCRLFTDFDLLLPNPHVVNSDYNKVLKVLKILTNCECLYSTLNLKSEIGKF